MKVVRTYKVTDKYVRCICDFILEETDEFNEDTLWCERWPISLAFRIGYPSVIYDNDLRISVNCHPNVPHRFVLDELSRFINTINQMYEL